MNKINALSPEQATDKARLNLEIVNKKLGRIPAMYAVMANSPAVLDAYVKFNGALNAGTIGSKLAERIAVASAEHNGCTYCLSAHSFFGEKAGISKTELEDARRFHAGDAKINAALQFEKKLLETPHDISPADAGPLRQAGYTDGEILEIVANTVRNIFTNYINVLADTEVDWPLVKTFNTVGE